MWWYLPRRLREMPHGWRIISSTPLKKIVPSSTQTRRHSMLVKNRLEFTTLSQWENGYCSWRRRPRGIIYMYLSVYWPIENFGLFWGSMTWASKAKLCSSKYLQCQTVSSIDVCNWRRTRISRSVIRRWEIEVRQSYLVFSVYTRNRSATWRVSNADKRQCADFPFRNRRSILLFECDTCVVPLGTEVVCSYIFWASTEKLNSMQCNVSTTTAPVTSLSAWL